MQIEGKHEASRKARDRHEEAWLRIFFASVVPSCAQKQEESMPTMLKAGRLADLVSIGPAMLRDFEMLGVRSVAQLAREEPEDLYKRLCTITGQRQDPCVLDVFCAAVAQARDPQLPPAKRQWWYYSRQRKRTTSAQQRSPRRSEG
jgi:Pathogenicity locus